MRILISVALASGLFACSGGDGSGLACDFTACGGDPVGEWTFVDACVEGTFPAPAECPTATISLVSLDVSGTVSVDAAMTYTSSVTADFNLRMHVPASCLPDGVTCDALTDPAEGRTCATGADGCDCTSNPEPTPDTASGTWSVADNQITLVETGSTDAPTPADYCVAGDTMTVRITNEEGLKIGYQLTRS